MSAGLEYRLPAVRGIQAQRERCALACSLTTNVIKQQLGLDLSPEERRAEDALGAE